MRVLAAGLVLLLVNSGANSDFWAPPEAKTYTSPNGTYRLTVFPRQLEGALPFFEDKLAEKPLAGQRPGGLKRCEAVLERRTGKGYGTIWRKPLVNDVAPTSALVSDIDGRFVTFDNWHFTGYGDDAIAIYDGNGVLIRKFALSDIIPESHVAQLPRSVSSIIWSGKHKIHKGASVELQIIVPPCENPHSQQCKYQSLRIRLHDGVIEK